jgi:putative spermidine/putrescine transport system permease protein
VEPTDVTAAAPTSEQRPGAGPASSGAGSQRGRWAGTYLPMVPFFGYVGLFLLLPTVFVLSGAFQSADGTPSLENIATVLREPRFLQAFGRSVQLSLVSALIGAILGGLLAWAVSVGGPGGRLRQISVAASGVLAQFGGVMLAFAFLATFGFTGLVTIVLRDTVGIDLTADSTWLYGMTGLTIVYTYFQIPLMVIVFLPALDGLRQEWWEASTSLGGSSWSYWRHVGGPILAPSFLGAVLLLFANAFSAYATAAALVSQGSPIVPLQIREAMSGEVIQGQANLGKALALGMIIVVVVVMTLYALLQRRASKWLR